MEWERLEKRDFEDMDRLQEAMSLNLGLHHVHRVNKEIDNRWCDRR